MLAETLRRRHSRGRYFSIVVAAEDAKFATTSDNITQDTSKNEFGHVKLGGIGNCSPTRLSSAPVSRPRAAVVFGHIQRGGTPSTS